VVRAPKLLVVRVHLGRVVDDVFVDGVGVGLMCMVLLVV
jgi:hypothetical protein